MTMVVVGWRMDSFNQCHFKTEIESACLKAISHGMFSIYVFGAYVENISSEIEICTVFLTTCGKHTK